MFTFYTPLHCFNRVIDMLNKFFLNSQPRLYRRHFFRLEIIGQPLYQSDQRVQRDWFLQEEIHAQIFGDVAVLAKG